MSDTLCENGCAYMEYLGACSLLGDLARHVKGGEDRYRIERALADATKRTGIEYEKGGGGTFVPIFKEGEA